MARKVDKKGNQLPILECPAHGEYIGDASDSPCPACEEGEHFIADIPMTVGADWTDLRKQKQTLLKVIGICEKLDPESYEVDRIDLHGILHFLDHIQDNAAKEVGEEHIFQFDGE